MGPSSAAAESNRDAGATFPAFANRKSATAPPEVTEDENVQLRSMASSVESKLPLHDDVMQLARLGEIGPIQKLFEEGKYNAKYHDGEGITPLHVCIMSLFQPRTWLIREFSGQLSTIITPFVSSWWSRVQKSTRKAASPLQRRRCGLLRGAICISYSSCSCTAQTLCSRMVKDTTSFI